MACAEGKEPRFGRTLNAPLPENALGADLIWWRTANGMRTIANVFWAEAQAFPDPVHLQALLFDASGQAVRSWRIDLRRGEWIFVDSAADGPWRELDGQDGVLALYACTSVPPSRKAREAYNRLFPVVDWRTADGRIATLHSDQVVCRGRDRRQELTEVVVLESADERNALVFLNGEQEQDETALEISVTNCSGEVRHANYAVAMRPFTVHRIPLVGLWPDLADFCGGQPLLASAIFSSRGLFSRPYVETTGTRWGAYHAGNVYSWSPLPYFAHAMISGEVNPVAVIHDRETRTIVNLLHSHDGIEDEMLVSVALFDTDGVCVADRPAWRRVPRLGLARFDIAELLPDPTLPFRGHVALGFAAKAGQSVPRHLQALLEYRRGTSVARTMTWSDEWNSNVRLARRDRSARPALGRSYFRVCEDLELGTEVAVTNAGHAGYRGVAEVRMTLGGLGGRIADTAFQLGPYATRIATVEQLFPGAREALAPSGLGMLIIESTSDLANLAFTRHRGSGALAVEHFMAMASEQEGKIEWPAGC